MSIKESDLFKGVSQRVITRIGSGSEEETFKKGAVVFRAGSKADYLYVLVNGNVDVTVQRGEKARFVVDRPGEVFGWSALVGPYTYTATATCSNETSVIKVPRDLIEHAVIEHPEEGLAIFKNLTGIIAQRLRFAYQLLPPET
jgi:CRP/FNR family cyclic AMP-dependent transcriptional regulator